MPTVKTEIRDRIAVVTIDRPQVRNAVDRAAAEALAKAFRDFDADDSLDVAILTGAGGHFCAGADLKALAGGEGSRLSETGDGPMGPTRMLLSKPVIGQSRALDLILTGRGISGDEALGMGLANRVTAPGRALEVAIDLARLIASFPQRCMRSDRLSAYEQWSMDWSAATLNEFRRGSDVVSSGETLKGASRFASGTGRHGIV